MSFLDRFKKKPEPEVVVDTLRKKQKKFFSWFKFYPERLSEERYRKEAMIKLSFLASALMISARLFSEHPNQVHLRNNYNLAFIRYNTAFKILEHFAPHLTERIPHWTELPVYLKDWLEGKTLHERPVYPEAVRPKTIKA